MRSGSVRVTAAVHQVVKTAARSEATEITAGSGAVLLVFLQ